MALKIGLVGLGKIAVDQHIPAIRGIKGLQLVAGCSPASAPEGVVHYQDMGSMLAAHPEIEAVAICTPPQVRHQLAREAIAAGKHVFLEKPPAATLGEAASIAAMAARHGVTALAGWHSRFAPGVESARNWMLARPIKSIRICWKENVRQWHPGQKWIFEAGGMGVFDPGINALSILTGLLGGHALVRKAALHVPSNCSAPIQAELEMVSGRGVPIDAEFDFLQAGQQTWSIFVESLAGDSMALHLGGRIMEVNGKVVLDEPEREYPAMYEHFLRLVAVGHSDVDITPLQAVADAFLVGKITSAEPYFE
ncbi:MULTISPECIES: Gfo/Idh/MocA family protein [unclassified Duganella]|uniref:Gfo/Idh/MocA family protein n=1 Tax=unclassified Duganella TaxID=2636909 RepID=UPI0006FDA04A|nr:MULTISPECIES: Gfo/Idh/MocA family oxidoreductase [unclassified Duganella]KQV59754.1 galactose 1-dehydrogenase [Duganella sp. Root336D2]KRB87377.1 galactose 1-dehydrogenase [Duganella sp. Root198D2]